MTSDTPRVMFQSPQNPKTWTPSDGSGVINCASNGDAKKAEEIFNSLSSQLAAKDAELAETRRRDGFNYRERIRLEAELAALKVQSDDLGNRAADEIEGLDKELSESRAQVARLRALMSEANDVCRSAYQIAERGINGQTNWAAWIKRLEYVLNEQHKALAVLPDQSARDADVLGAAEEWEPISTELKKYMSATEIPDDGNFLELVEKLDKAERRLSQAVRGDKE